MDDGFKNLDNSILLSMVDSDKEYGDVTDSFINELAQARLLASVDTKTGAPANVRAAVSAAQTETDRLATLKNFYPDAVPVQALDPEFGVAKFGYGNFVYTNPETGQLTLFDEDLKLFGMSVPGLRDFVDVGPEIAETAGAIGGALYGATIAAPTVVGIPAGAVAGEAIGSASAREAYIGLLNYFGETEDNRTGAERLFDAGTTAVMNAIGGPFTNKIVLGIKHYGGMPIRYMTGATTPDAKKALKDMETIGVTDPSAGMVTVNPTINLMESALAAAPTSTKIMHENAYQVINQMDVFSRDLAQRYGGVRTTAEAAEELVSSAKAARLRYDVEVNRLYDEVTPFMPDSLISDGAHTQQFINKYLAQSKTATGKDFVNPALRMAEKVIKDAGDEVLTYKQLKDFKVSLGKNIASAEAAGARLSGSDAKIKELYGYVVRDLDALVARGGDEASKAYKAANSYVKANTGKSGGITYLDNVIKKGEARATAALKYVESGAKDGGEDLIKLKSLLSPDEYNVMAGYMLGKMGLPTAGRRTAVALGEEAATEGAEVLAQQGFSPNTFIRSWNNISLEAKEALFRGTEHEKLIPELDALVDTVQRIGAAAEQMNNPSGTARVLGALSLFGIGAGDAAFGRAVGSEMDFGFSALIAPYMSAKLFTDPSFVRWLSEGIEKAAYDPLSFGQHVRRLYQIYELNPEIREEVRAITEGLTGASLERVPAHNSKSAPAVTTAAPNEQAFREVTNPEIAGKLLPDVNLASQIDEFTLPSVTESTPELAMSPTIVPDERDREIAMREAGGIGSLV